MLTCLVALSALAAVGVGEIPGLAERVEAQGRSLDLLAAEPSAPAFAAAVDAFADDALRLSDSLRAAGVSDDLPCIFKGISEDARERGAAAQVASGDARDAAVTGLRVLLTDAIEIAPLAAKEAAKSYRNE